MKIVNNMKKPSIGTWLTIYSEAIAEILCNSGYEWITIDLEHTPITLSQAEKLIRVIDLKGVKPFVRVSSNNEAEIKKVLDFGARGIIVPMINNVTDVKKAIASTFILQKVRGEWVFTELKDMVIKKRKWNTLTLPLVI